MQPTLEVQELSVTFVNSLQNPAAVVNYDSLISMGVILPEWDLARDPIYTSQVVQLQFNNGMSLTAHPGRILLTEVMGVRSLSDSQLSATARRLVRSLPNLEYQAMGFNPLGHVKLGETPEAVQHYFTQTLLAPGAWQQIGNEPVKSRISFTYRLDACQLNLTVSEAGFRHEDETVAAVVLFAGNFSCDITEGTAAARVEQICQALDRTAIDVALFQSIVNEKFLSPYQVQPSLLPVFS